MGSTSKTRGYRSLFWPIVLISIGVIWLLGNLGILGPSNLLVLFRLWPLLLIAIGLDLLIGRDSAFVGTLIGLGTVGLVIVLMLVGPGLGLVPSAEVQQATINEPLDGAQTAAITLDLSVGDVTITALDDSNDLIAGELNYVGELDFQTGGGANRSVHLGVRGNEGGINFDFTPFGSFFPGGSDLQLRWDLGLSPDVPLSLNINGGVGNSSLTLDALQLEALDINGGVGDVVATLPGGDYQVSLDGGVGDTTLNVAEGANFTLNANGGVGSVTVDVPDGAAVRVEKRGGLGDARVPGGYTQISSGNDVEIWESTGFSGADDQIVIVFNGGIGGLNIR